MPKKPAPFNAKQILFVRMVVNGHKRKEILKEVFGLDVDTADQKAINAADGAMKRWRHHPDYDPTWKDEMRKALREITPDAINVFKEQLKAAKEPWLQNKAANDIMTHGKPLIYGDEDKAVRVQIEGLPDLGTPDTEE